MKRAFFLLAAIAASASAHADATAAGRQIYVSGKAAHPMTASVAGSAAIPATLLPCANCHGADGRGVPEGGIVPANITWLELTKPYRAEMADGRRRPAYDERSLRRAITEGIDSAGHPLHPAMPHYTMSPHDVSELVAFLKVLGREEAPGVTATSVRIGTIVPDGGGAGAQMAAVLTAYFQDAGEIHGRRIALRTLTPANLEAALQHDPPFALAGGLLAGADAEVDAAVERAEIPLILPVSISAGAPAEHRQRFDLFPDLAAQVRGLVRFSGVTRLRVIARDEELASAARRAIASLPNAPAIVTDESAAALFLDPGATLAAVPPQGKSPLLLLGNLLPADFFKEAASYAGRITVALTVTPDDLTAAGLAEYRAFSARHSIPAEHLASQLSAYAAAKVVVQALKESGRDLTRDSLRASLENLYEFSTGVTPPVTFGRSRRIAAPHLRLAGVDPNSGRLVPAGTIDTDD